MALSFVESKDCASQDRRFCRLASLPGTDSTHVVELDVGSTKHTVLLALTGHREHIHFHVFSFGGLNPYLGII